MCIAALGVAASLASSMASFGAAQADYEAKAAQWRQNFTNSMAAGVEDQKKLNLRMTQEGEQFTQKAQLQEVEGAEAAARAEVSAASGNITGLSLTNIVTGLQRDTLRNQEVLDTNYRNTVLQLEAENVATETEIQNRINSVQRPTAPSPLGYIASGIGGALKFIPQDEA